MVFAKVQGLVKFESPRTLVFLQIFEILKVSRSRNMKQKIYEILTSPKIQTNGVILNNCID